jgi:hypothetical protein
MVMVAQVFVNQRQVANAKGVRHCVVRCCEGDVGRLLLAVGDLEQWSGVEWSGDFDDGWLARWLVLRQSSFALSQPCKEIYRYNKVTQPAEVTSFLYTHTIAPPPLCSIKNAIHYLRRDSWPTCALGLCLSPFTRYLRREM